MAFKLNIQTGQWEEVADDSQKDNRASKRNDSLARKEAARKAKERAERKAREKAERKAMEDARNKRLRIAILIILSVSFAVCFLLWSYIHNKEAWVKIFHPGEQDIIEGSAVVADGQDSVFTVNGVSFKMMAVDGGTFEMGSETGYLDERPVHSETVDDFMVGETEVTQALWEAVMENNPSEYKWKERPVHNVSWYDCQTFIKRLNKLTGRRFHLPTEAEWEYAARGGHKSKGIYKYSGSQKAKDVAWYYRIIPIMPHEVKKKRPNELGVYDMSGNVEEWCEDWESGGRVSRGGSYASSEYYCRVSDREYHDPTHNSDSRGFRLVLSVEK